MVVDMVVKKLVVALFGGWNSGERGGNKNCSNGGRGAGFRPTLDPIVSVARVRRRDEYSTSNLKCKPIWKIWGDKKFLSFIGRKWNGSRHLVFWSLGTLTGLRDRVRGLIA
jgi:hypothetical protein